MKPHVLMIDNYDSFTYNLVQAFLSLGVEVTVRTNDAVSVEEALGSRPTHVVVSPGPGRPENAGISMDAIRAFAGRAPVLGVCLGHQALAAAFGSTVGSAKTLMHGKPSEVYHDRRTIYEGLPSPFPAGRYHSLAVLASDLGPELSVTSCTADGEIMGIRHNRLPLEGVQFHPESLLTPVGDSLLRNFLELVPTHRVAVNT